MRRDDVLERPAPPLQHAEHHVQRHESDQQNRHEQSRRGEQRKQGASATGPGACHAGPVEPPDIDEEQATAQ